MSGVIAPGTTPFVVNANGSDSWSIPGYFNGVAPWQGSDTFTDFHITFSGLPDGVTLANTFSSSCYDNSQNVFCDDATSVVWTPVLDSPNSISFYAPSGDSGLHPGDTFYTNIFFTGAPDDALHFTGSWTQDGGAVPEPSTLGLAGLGAAALGLWRRRKR
jgi:hypothetical protein